MTRTVFALRPGAWVVSVVFLGLLAGCNSTQRTPYLGGRVDPRAVFAPGIREVSDDVSYWDGLTTGGGSPSIVVNLTEQRAYFYQGQKLVGVALVATGREGFGTPAGNYKIIEKLVEKRSNLYGINYDVDGNVVHEAADSRLHPPPPGGRFEGADMPYWMRLTKSGIGMHQGPIPVPGSPASHGCIRVSKLVVQDFFANAPLNTPVRITY
jgi:lipoprotein-anchoring transpeptidase ErfK/SrfK